MAIHGVEIVVSMNPPANVSEEKAEKIYTCLTENFAMKSVDMFIRDGGNSLTFLLGIETLALTSSDEEMAHDISREALERAFEVAEGQGTSLFGLEISQSRTGVFS